MTTNAFVGAYIDRLLEQQQTASEDGRGISTASSTNGADASDHHHRSSGTLTFEHFVHIFWVFSASASRAEKEEGMGLVLFVPGRRVVGASKSDSIFTFSLDVAVGESEILPSSVSHVARHYIQCDTFTVVPCPTYIQFSRPKPKVVKTLLGSDERGMVDRNSIFRFMKCLLLSAPDRGLEAVVDDLMQTFTVDEEIKLGAGDTNASGGSRVSVEKFLDGRGFLDKLTLHM